MSTLLHYFEGNSGRMIEKWLHYFPIYERHFARFRGTDVHVAEVGIWQGGSLEMWRHFFGPRARIIGIDVDERCRTFTGDQIDVVIGNQESAAFWSFFRDEHPRVDVLIDDGGHTMRGQITTFREVFPHVAEDGVYLVEDLHTSYWNEYGGGLGCAESFVEFGKRLIDELNAWHIRGDSDQHVTRFTRTANSLHFYDSVLVVEKSHRERPESRRTGVASI